MSVHDAIVPAIVRPETRVSARLRPSESDKTFVDVTLKYISPLGIEVAFKPANPISPGTIVDVELVISGQRTTHTGLVVTSTANSLGIRFSNPKPGKSASSDRRRYSRWLCPHTFLPAAVAPNPLAFNEFLSFSVLDISKGGMLLQTSLSNKFLVPHSLIDLTTSFPMVGTAAMTVQIARVEIGTSTGKEHLLVGVEFLRSSRRARLVIDRYLHLFGNNPNNEGKGQQLLGSLNFLDLRSPEELRHLEVLLTSLDEPIQTLEGLNDDLDSRIVLGKLQGTVVAMARVRFAGRGHRFLFDKTDYSGAPPPLDKVIHVSDVFVDPNISAAATLTRLFQHIAISCVTAKRPYVLVTLTKNYSNQMESIGFKKIDTSNLEDGNTNQIWMTNAVNAMTHPKISVTAWNLVWKDVAIHLTKLGILNLTGTEKILLKMNVAWSQILSLFRRGES